ncbi:MAG: N-terminal phage integrase SAM-like domain-containing protein [Acidimicrobiia bacterium]|nr:N-terminal phage integrase SAM-like domain-containing protein [Acidimicrobiia bacterium]
MASIEKRTIRTSLGTEARYDVRYRGPGGRQRKRTVRTRREADRRARTVEVEKETGSYVAPSSGRVLFGDDAGDWLEHRPTLRPRTRELYEGQLRNHVLPTFGGTPLSAIIPAAVRAWWSELHESTAAAIRYQHATRERDRALADLVDEIVAPDRTSAPRREQREPGVAGSGFRLTWIALL